jgi:hypothetical protein
VRLAQRSAVDLNLLREQGYMTIRLGLGVGNVRQLRPTSRRRLLRHARLHDRFVPRPLCDIADTVPLRLLQEADCTQLRLGVGPPLVEGHCATLRIMYVANSTGLNATPRHRALAIVTRATLPRDSMRTITSLRHRSHDGLKTQTSAGAGSKS